MLWLRAPSLPLCTTPRPQIDRDVADTSGTNLASGIDAATQEMKGCRACMEADRSSTENRVILITDAQPNQVRR